MHTDFPHYEGLSQRVIGLFNAVKNGIFFVLAPAVEMERMEAEHVGNLRVLRYKLLFLRKVVRNRILYRLLFNILFSLALLLDITRLKNLQADVIQAEQQLSLIPSLVIGNVLKKPVIVDDVTWRNEEFGLRIPKAIIKAIRIIEEKAINSCAVAIFSSYHIREKYTLRCQTFVIPNGISMPACPVSEIFDAKTLLFLGSMYSDQNRQAVLAAIRIFQGVKEYRNDVNMIVVGGPASMIDRQIIELADKDENVKILGYVSNELKNNLISKASLILMPYFNSPLTGGCRIKALEFFCYGKVVVSTLDGVAGIAGIEDRRNVLIAETPQKFVDVINEYLSKPESYVKIGNEAKKLAGKYLWENVAASYRDAFLFVTSCHENSKSRARDALI